MPLTCRRPRDMLRTPSRMAPSMCRFDPLEKNLRVFYIRTYNTARAVRDVVFENFVINGVAISDEMPKPGWFRTADMAPIHIGDHVHGLDSVCRG